MGVPVGAGVVVFVVVVDVFVVVDVCVVELLVDFEVLAVDVLVDVLVVVVDVELDVVVDVELDVVVVGVAVLDDEEVLVGSVLLPTLHHPSLFMMKSILPSGWLCPPALSASAAVWQKENREHVKSVLPPCGLVSARRKVGGHKRYLSVDVVER